MTRLARGAALGFALGAAWGVLARVWMRLITTDPEFSWSGTLMIIGLSAVLGLGVGVVDAARRTGRTGLWTLAVVPGLLLFMSPGMLLAPSFLLGGLAWGARGRAARVVGLLAVAGSVGVGIWAGLGDITVTYVVGYVALALALAWASSLVWQRSKRRPAEPDVARTEDRPERCRHTCDPYGPVRRTSRTRHPRWSGQYAPRVREPTRYGACGGRGRRTRT